MATENSPAFRFYVKDWASSMNVKLMGATGRGIHMDMMVQCWLEGHVPDDPKQIAMMVGEPLRTVNKYWERVRKCYKTHPTLDGMLINERIEIERDKQREYRAQKVEAGQKGAKKRWHRHSAANGNAMAEGMANDGSSFALSSSGSEVQNLEVNEVQGGEPGKRWSALDIPDVAQALFGVNQKAELQEEQSWSASMRFLHKLFPPSKIGHGVSPSVRIWQGRISEARLNRAIKEIQNGEYPGRDGARVGWRDLDDDHRRRVVLAVLNPMANERG